MHAIDIQDHVSLDAMIDSVYHLHPKPNARRTVVMRVLSQKDDHENTCFHYAANHNYPPLIDSIIRPVFQVFDNDVQAFVLTLHRLLTAQNDNGDTPFLVALKNKNFETAKKIFELMRDYDITLDTRNKKGETAARVLSELKENATPNIQVQLQQWLRTKQGHRQGQSHKKRPAQQEQRSQIPWESP